MKFVRRFLFCALLIAGLGWGRADAIVNPLLARYAGRYFIVVRSFNNSFVFGGTFRVFSSGAVRGTMYDRLNLPLKINSHIDTTGRFVANLIIGSKINTLSIGITSTGQTVGRDEISLSPSTGHKDDSFFNRAGLYRGKTNDGRQMVIVIELNRRISGSFEQSIGIFQPLYGGASIAGGNIRSYLSVTKFQATFVGINKITGTWTQAVSKGVTLTGTFNLKRQPPQ